MQAGVPDTILNRPYKTSSYVPEIKAGNKCMAFGDFSYPRDDRNPLPFRQSLRI